MKDRNTKLILKDFNKKSNKKYEQYYDEYLELCRKAITKLFNADKIRFTSGYDLRLSVFEYGQQQLSEALHNSNISDSLKIDIQHLQNSDDSESTPDKC